MTATSEAFTSSELTIDHEHRRVLDDVLIGRATVETLLEERR